jgi:hypothetical protein
MLISKLDFAAKTLKTESPLDILSQTSRNSIVPTSDRFSQNGQVVQHRFHCSVCSRNETLSVGSKFIYNGSPIQVN